MVCWGHAMQDQDSESSCFCGNNINSLIKSFSSLFFRQGVILHHPLLMMCYSSPLITKSQEGRGARWEVRGILLFREWNVEVIRKEQTPPPSHPISTHPGHAEPGASLAGKHPNRHIRAENDRKAEEKNAREWREEWIAEAIIVTDTLSVEVRRPDWPLKCRIPHY